MLTYLNLFVKYAHALNFSHALNFHRRLFQCICTRTIVTNLEWTVNMVKLFCETSSTGQRYVKNCSTANNTVSRKIKI